MADEQGMAEVLDALVKEGRVVKRGDRYRLAEWPDEDETTSDAVRAVVDESRVATSVQPLSPPVQMLEAARGRQDELQRDVRGAEHKLARAEKRVAELNRHRAAEADRLGVNETRSRARMAVAADQMGRNRLLATAPAWREAEARLGPIADLAKRDGPSLSEAAVRDTLEAMVAEGTMVKDGDRYRLADEDPTASDEVYVGKGARSQLLQEMQALLDSGEMSSDIAADLAKRGLNVLIDEASGRSDRLLASQGRERPEDYVDPHRAERDSEAVAEVIADLREGRVRRNPEVTARLFDAVRSMWEIPKVIDATPIYHQALAKPEIKLYEDHPSIAPPFDEFVTAYHNQHGNVIVMHTVVEQPDSDGDEFNWKAVEANPVDWDRVRWRLFTSVWVGGKDGTGRAVPTTGPMYAWRYAVYDTGEPADLTWVDLSLRGTDEWDMAQVTLLESLWYLNCTNVEYVEPRRSRGFARRMQRMGVKVGQIRVFPVSKAARRGQPEGVPVGGDTPASAVRGHFAHFGDCCPGRHEPNGLAFGRLQGRFYIPPHVRGNRELGENERSYQLVGGGRP